MLAETAIDPVECAAGEAGGVPDIDGLVHDLRGPLSVIVAFAESIDGAPREERARFVARLVANAHRALAVLEEFAALSDLRAGDVEPYRRPMDLVEVARQAVDATADAASRAVEITCVAADECVSMLADRDLLGMALRSVLRRMIQEAGGRQALRILVAGEGDHAAIEIRCVGGGTRHRHPDAEAMEILQRVIGLHGGLVVFDGEDRDLVLRVRMPRSSR